MSEITKRLTVGRGRPNDLGGLLSAKDFWNDFDGWRSLIRSYEPVSPTKPREVEVVIFRPTEEEHEHWREKVPPVFVERKLKPASLFEILALIPSHKDHDARKEFAEQLGDESFLFAHGHTDKSFLGCTPAYFAVKYGRLEFKSGGLHTSHTRCWYSGYRKIKP